MEFAHITLFVRDMEASLHFYHKLLGLPIRIRRPMGQGEMAFLGGEGTANIELISSPDHLQMTYTGFGVGILAPSLEEALAMLAENGHPVYRGPVSPAPGVSFAFVRDPDGVSVQIMQGH